MTVGMIGLGLIGGSMVKSMKANTDCVVYGQDSDKDVTAAALSSGAVDGVLDDENIAECDLILIAIAPGALLRWVDDNAAKIDAHTVLVDLCGVKREICRHIEPLAEKHGFSYVGGHPMAGKEVRGFANATADLYNGASMILTPGDRSGTATVEMLKSFFLRLGFARIVISTPEEHDTIISYTSQLAHVTSSAYIKSPTAQQQFGFSAGSYRDMTRVARLDENMWTELFMLNADHLTAELETLIGHLEEYHDALKSRDAARICSLLKEGRELKATAGGD